MVRQVVKMKFATQTLPTSEVLVTGAQGLVDVAEDRHGEERLELLLLGVGQRLGALELRGRTRLHVREEADGEQRENADEREGLRHEWAAYSGIGESVLAASRRRPIEVAATVPSEALLSSSAPRRAFHRTERVQPPERGAAASVW